MDDVLDIPFSPFANGLLIRIAAISPVLQVCIHIKASGAAMSNQISRRSAIRWTLTVQY
jgi:hypothetical protein